MDVKLLKYTPDAERLCASAAMTYYKSKGTSKLLEKLDVEEARKTIHRVMSYGHHCAQKHTCLFLFHRTFFHKSLRHPEIN